MLSMKILAAVAVGALYLMAGSAAFAGQFNPSAPEIDPGTLASVASGIAGAYLLYRGFRAKQRTPRG